MRLPAESPTPPAREPAMTIQAEKKMRRIRADLLPESARYAEIDGKECVCIPVADFGDWYEDALDAAVANDRRDADDGGRIPIEEIFARLDARTPP
jgi:hypothetical protein